jgi:hypothetical protein
MIVLQKSKPIPFAPDYIKCLTANQFYELSYDGGPDYKDGKDAKGNAVFVKHDNESPNNSAKRKRLALYRNYCKPIVRRYNNFIFGNSIRRDMTPAFQDWIKDVDLQGTSLQEFMKSQTLQAQKLGRTFILVDTTKTQDFQTVAQAQAAGNRMYCVPIHPDRVVNYTRVHRAYTEILLHFPDENKLMLYTAATVQTALLKDGKIVSVGAAEPHGFGKLPVICMTAYDDGQSQLRDIAEANKSLFNDDALYREEMWKNVFSQQFATGLNPDEIKPIAVGSRKILCIPGRNPAEVRFDRLSAEVSQAASLADMIKADVTEIHRLAGLYDFNSDAMGQRASGNSLQIKFNEISLMAASISQHAEKAENAIIDFYNGQTNSGIHHSDYPDSDELDSESLKIELDRTIEILDSQLPQVIKQEQIRAFTNCLFPNLPPDKQAQLETELQEPIEKPEPSPMEPAAPDQIVE